MKKGKTIAYFNVVSNILTLLVIYLYVTLFKFKQMKHMLAYVYFFKKIFAFYFLFAYSTYLHLIHDAVIKLL